MIVAFLGAWVLSRGEKIFEFMGGSDVQMLRHHTLSPVVGTVMGAW